MSKRPKKVKPKKRSIKDSNEDNIDLSDLFGFGPSSKPKRKSKRKRKKFITIRSSRRSKSSAARRRSAEAAAAKRRRLTANAKRSRLRYKKRRYSGGDNVFDQKLFGCFKNPSICILSLVLPCYVQGKIAYEVDRSCLLYGFLCVVPVVNIICRVKVRELVRKQNKITGSTATDCLAVMCYPCSLSQEVFELEALFEPEHNSMDRE